MAERFQITIDGTTFHAQMDDNPLTEQLAAICPFETEMQRRGGHEYYARLSKPFLQKGCRMISKTKKNQISYFDGWNAISLLFEDADISPYTVAYLGEFEEDAATYLEKCETTVRFRLERDTE